MEANTAVIRIKPYFYIHVLDNNKNVTRVVEGPATFTRQDHEKLIEGPSPMITVPPRHYCIIQNPVVRDAKGAIVTDKWGQAKNLWSDEEIRFTQEPFPLYPGEKLSGSVSPLQVIRPNTALRLSAIRDIYEDITDSSSSSSSSEKEVVADDDEDNSEEFEEEEEEGEENEEEEKKDGNRRRRRRRLVHHAGDEWLFKGPGTYIPRVEAKVVEVVEATIIPRNHALRLQARREMRDRHGVDRKTGEEWLIREAGAYLPDVDEKVVGLVAARVLTPLTALHLAAIISFRDVYGVERKAGEEWLVTSQDSEAHIPDVYERVVGECRVTVLTDREYAVVVNPVGEDGLPQLGKRELRKGETTFFLKPGEVLEGGAVQPVYVLSEEEALLLTAKEEYVEPESGTRHMPGDRWMVNGPRDFIPDVEVEVLERRKSIPLDTNEGVYVRDIKTGEVSAKMGRSYMLGPNEELWEKELSPIAEQLLSSNVLLGATVAAAKPAGKGEQQQPQQQQQQQQQQELPKRDKTRVVTYRAPYNTVMQIYDYKEKRSRIVFGPQLVILNPDEEFTVVSLSGSTPKKPHVIKTLSLLLGPDFMTDVIVVETSDHARLSLRLSYNWQFNVRPGDEEAGAKVFKVPDFVGDACKAIAARVRSTVASTTFDTFHKNSARLIHDSIFGKDGDTFAFPANNLVINSVDIQSVEPVDQKTRDELQRSVQLAISITTQSQEAAARQEAERLEQEAKGKLRRQMLDAQAEAEKARKEFVRLNGENILIEKTGAASADARARAEAAKIESEAAVNQARLQAEARRLAFETDAKIAREKLEQELAHKKAMDALELDKAKELAKIEADKFGRLVGAIGADTIRAIAQAGPEMQAKLLGGLGLKSVMITDGNSPINLFNTASGLIGGAAPAVKQQQQQQPTVTEEDYGSDDEI